MKESVNDPCRQLLKLATAWKVTAVENDLGRRPRRTPVSRSAGLSEVLQRIGPALHPARTPVSRSAGLGEAGYSASGRGVAAFYLRLGDAGYSTPESIAGRDPLKSVKNQF